VSLLHVLNPKKNQQQNRSTYFPVHHLIALSNMLL